ncbi:SRPBCC family protein [Planctomonas psychrotolerans]|uniref:SRPBCC family protein n=1 Tax=Planctomonas psychrotolerans TaxID=2528712 RepID=UPI001239EB0D|nr:SRPBCC domain-containing protein [Planctomonas psychrotolerans]
MPLIESKRDVDTLSMTFVAEFDADVERVWQLWEDPRQLERWWGPPTYPATFDSHDFVVGGRSAYHMTGPDGELFRGWWTVDAIDAPHRIEFTDGFADENGEPADFAEPSHGVVTLEEVAGKTRMTVVSTFANAESLEQMLQMGMEEGMREAIGQIDAILASQPVI